VDPRTDRQIERLISLVERLLDRGYLDEHDRLKIEAINARNDINRMVERAEKLEEASENTGSIYLTELRDKLKAREEGGDKWLRYIVATFVSLLITVVAALLGYMAAHH
jgi:signal transduction histidine kinase